MVPSSISPPISKVYLSPLTDHLTVSSASPGSSAPACCQVVTFQSPSSFLMSSFAGFSSPRGAATPAEDPTTRPTATANRERVFITHLRCHERVKGHHTALPI